MTALPTRSAMNPPAPSAPRFVDAQVARPARLLARVGFSHKFAVREDVAIVLARPIWRARREAVRQPRNADEIGITAPACCDGDTTGKFRSGAAGEPTLLIPALYIAQQGNFTRSVLGYGVGLASGLVAALACVVVR